MNYYSVTEYKSYFDERMSIIKERTELCQGVIENIKEYDYWSYYYAYYLCDINLEELNYLRYLFGPQATSFYEILMFCNQRKYLAAINKYGWPERMDWKNCRIGITTEKDSLKFENTFIVPHTFEEIQPQLEMLDERVITIIEE